MQKCTGIFPLFFWFLLKLHQRWVQVIVSSIQSVPYLWFPSTSTMAVIYFLVQYRKPRDTCASRFGNCLYCICGAFPLFQTFNILPQCAASHQADIEPAQLAAFITTLPWARSATQSLVGPFLLKEIKASFLELLCQSIQSFLLNATVQPQVGDKEWLISIEAWMVCSLNTTKTVEV